MIKVIYNKVCGRCVQSEPLTSGMVGQPIHFEYSHDFDGLAVTAVFTDGKNTVDVVNPRSECIIPHEVLTTVGAMVKVGIYAVKGDKLVIPTIYAHIGVVLKGADPSGDVSIDPTLPVWAQTQALIGNLSQIETETKDSLVAAINEVKQTTDRKANAADLAPVATSGSYNDLSDKPTIPSVPTATIEANTAARHTHDNKTLLDSITGALKTAWNTASEWVSTNGANVLSHLSDGVRHITEAERSAWNGKQDKLIAGENITISADGRTISATGSGGGSGSVQPDWNQNDNTQPDYVKNRPFYSETRNVTIEDAKEVALDGFPAFVTGDTVTVNVDGVEHSLVAYYDEDEGVFTIGDIYSDLENGKGQLGWQIWYSLGDNKAFFYATEAHTISYLGVFIYKIDNKFVNFDGLVRTYNYYFKDESLYKTLYNSAGDDCRLYTCSDFILPDQDAQLFGFMSEFGFSKVDSVGLYSCFITGFIIAPMSARVRIARVVLGTDTSYMETMAADNGYTYTTNPNA